LNKSRFYLKWLGIVDCLEKLDLVLKQQKRWWLQLTASSLVTTKQDFRMKTGFCSDKFRGGGFLLKWNWIELFFVKIWNGSGRTGITVLFCSSLLISTKCQCNIHFNKHGLELQVFPECGYSEYNFPEHAFLNSSSQKK